jgi:hypothetical protein
VDIIAAVVVTEEVVAIEEAAAIAEVEVASINHPLHQLSNFQIFKF